MEKKFLYSFKKIKKQIYLLILKWFARFFEKNLKIYRKIQKKQKYVKLEKFLNFKLYIILKILEKCKFLN